METIARLSDRDLMLRAIELARKCTGKPNKISPKVGAVIARDGVIMGEAYRGELKTDEHGEFALIEKKLSGVTLAGATLLTTQEPCTSRNEPEAACALRIIERRIGKVFIGMLDPNPRRRGRGELQLRDAGIQIARFDFDLVPVVEELNRDFMRQYHRGVKRKRTAAETSDPVMPGQVGPNGYRIGYLENGDKVEWIPDDEAPGEEYSLLLRRNDKDIMDMYEELWEKVWWNRHQKWLGQIKLGEQQVSQPVLELAKEKAQQIEYKYGIENLSWDDVDWALLKGKMSSLAWVLGAEWDESLDT